MEIHDSLSPAYGKFYLNNKYEAIIGLSATIEKSTSYMTKSGKVFTKGDMIKKIAPICYKYNLKDSKKNETSRPLDIYVLSTELEAVKKTVKSGSKKKPFMQTEKSAYDYWSKRLAKSYYILDLEQQKLAIGVAAKRRSDIIYKAKSKIITTRELLNILEGKTIIFGNDIDSLLQITPNTVSSRNSDAENNRIRNAFESNKIKTIASFKKLKQGANLTGLDNCIIMSYYSISKDLIQRVGRLRDNGKIGNVFILLLRDTQEEVWFNNMLESISNFNIIYCPNLEYLRKKFKNE